MRWWIAFLLLCTGCNPIARVEYGYGSQYAVAKLANDLATGDNILGKPKAALPMDGHYASFKIGTVERFTDSIDVDASIGPAIFSSTKGPSGNFYVIEASPRFTYRTGLIEPYISGLLGVGYTEKLWPGEGTRFQFSVGGSIGLAVKFSESWSAYLGYRFFHVSNGSAIFGTKKPNVGYNTDMIVIGLEHGW